MAIIDPDFVAVVGVGGGYRGFALRVVLVGEPGWNLSPPVIPAF